MTFYLLGRDIKSTMQIINMNLKDPAFGVLICRMMIL